MYGQWGRDPRLDDLSGAPFEIPMQGLGVFACARRAWPGLNPRLRGFGAEEGYLHETFRRRGGRVLCHPRLQWAHRFQRPHGISYPNRWEDRIRNYLVAWGEMGWDVAPMEAHFVEELASQFDVAALIELVRGQVTHPLGVFDAVLCLADGGADGRCDSHEHPLALAWRVERVQPDPTLTGEHRRLSAWHGAIALASARGYRHALLLEDAAGPETLPAIDPPTWERPWDLCLVRGSPAEARPFPTAGRLALAGLAVAVHRDAFDRILADVGSDDAGRQAFLATWPDLDTICFRG